MAGRGGGGGGGGEVAPMLALHFLFEQTAPRSDTDTFYGPWQCPFTVLTGFDCN